MTAPRRMVILVDGYTDTSTAKTAICVIRYRPEEVVAVLDRGGAGKTSGQLLGVGGAIPVVASLADAPAANTLLLGIAPPGGKIPAHWRPIVLEALGRGMTVVSGLHEFLADDPEFAQAAARHGAALVDLRRNDEHDVCPSPRHSPRVPPHPHHRQRLQQRQNGRRRGSRPGPAKGGRRCRLRGHGPDRHPRGRQRLRGRPRHLRFRRRRGREARPGQSASRGDRRGRAGESLSSPLLGRDLEPAPRNDAARPDRLLRDGPQGRLRHARGAACLRCGR